MKNENKTLPRSVVFTVGCSGNVQALCMCLSSVIMQTVKPDKIYIRLEGDSLGMSNFYFEQICAFARLHKIKIQIEIGDGNGVRPMRDACVQDNLIYDYIWMGDDDVVYAPDFLEKLLDTFHFVNPVSVGWLNGVKADVSNVRNYPNFISKRLPSDSIKARCSYNCLYEHTTNSVKQYAEIFTLDTGAVLFSVDALKNSNAKFNLFTDHANAGGEDTIMAMQLSHKKYLGYVVPFAESYHLEKPNPNFGEFNARAELIRRTADVLGFKKEDALREFMPFTLSGNEDFKRHPDNLT